VPGPAPAGGFSLAAIAQSFACLFAVVPRQSRFANDLIVLVGLFRARKQRMSPSRASSSPYLIAFFRGRVRSNIFRWSFADRPTSLMIFSDLPARIVVGENREVAQAPATSPMTGRLVRSLPAAAAEERNDAALWGSVHARFEIRFCRASSVCA